MVNYPKWNEVSYAGENTPPKNVETPYAESWNMYFLKREDQKFYTVSGKPVHFSIRHPDTINWSEELKKVQHVLENLTPHQKQIATYWSEGPATKQWTPVIDKLIDAYGVEAPRAGRMLAALQAAMNDAFVVAWYYKFRWLVARPNQLDQTMHTFICTPRHPSYPSGHATVAGAAEVILAYFFPAERQKFKKLAKECADSRLYAGVHFPIDNIEGLKLGREIGKVVVLQLKEEFDSEGNPIDTPYRRPVAIDLPPPPYTQALPFDYDINCDSLIMCENASCSNCKDYPQHNLSKPAPPKLFY
ncbi:vanadium-dependent haloperoxidase [Bacillus coahuilensis]|uniref:vanadium-dependent haloperoxidase n=1 Tax=Bacillus coahuilensis TaxID=408580 RepID=UPI0009E6D1CC|nr:vanadium-dependent haloperoxidase [Bacillus coahuilensis]